MAKEQVIRLTVNGRSYEKNVAVRQTLADFLRDELHLTGTHLGCEHGVCGACTVLMNGRSVRSCLTLAVQAGSADILTVEGMGAGDGTLHPLQEAFHQHYTALESQIQCQSFLW